MEILSYKTESLARNIEIAEDMGMDKSFAINAKRRELTLELMELDNSIRRLKSYRNGNDVTMGYRDFILSEDVKRRAQILKQLDSIKQMTAINMNKSTLSEDQIETARHFPITQLIEFKHGKAIAFCHTDRNPSLYHANRTNRANCPVCDKSFNSIDVLVNRDGMSFAQAVRNLL